MTRYLLWRLISGASVIAGLVTLTFVAAYVLGDPVYLLIDREHSVDYKREYAALRQAGGYDRPLWVQFGDYVSHALRGDFGNSLWQHRPATEVVIERLPATGLLTASAVLLAVAVSVPFALIAARFAGRWPGMWLTAGATLLASMPAFWLGLALIYVFAVALHLFPTSGYGDLKHLVLPAIALAAVPAGHMMQVLQAAMASEYRQQYVTVARAKGLGERSIPMRHVLRNALALLITQAGLITVALVDAAVLVETVFAWPGIGQLSLAAVQRRDLPVLMTAVIVVGVITTIVNLLVDLAYAVVDPRVRYA